MTDPMLRVQAMNEFAEAVLREARDRGLLPTRRRHRRRKAKAKGVSKFKPTASGKTVKKPKSGHPLEEDAA